MRILPAEWAPQRFVQLTWPHIDTDWAPYLEAAYACYRTLARAITERVPLLVVTPEPEEVERQLRQANVDMSRCVITECVTNDTWARDHAFITVLDDATDEWVHNDFCFNGWGLKFAANRDNQINSTIFHEEVLDQMDDFADDEDEIKAHRYESHLKTVLEGGSIESDGCGTILTTTECLLNRNRNEYADKEEAEAMMREAFGANRFLWLDHGFLLGDDTDSHVDTLARLCPDDTIVYVQCTDPTDIHYDELHAMEEQLKTFRTASGAPYRLLPLPMADPIFERDFDDADPDEADQQLPATYANFLITDGAVLMPTYGQPHHDNRAKEVLQQAFPGRDIVGIDCRVLIRQHGSLHCITMQYPR